MNHTILNIDKTNWKPVKFGEVVAEPKEICKDIVVEGIEHVVGLEHIDTGDVHLRKSATIEESTTFSKKFKKGDVLFGRRRAYLKKAAQADFDGICSGDITVFRVKKELSSALLPFIVNNDKFFDYAVKHSAGGLSPRVKFKDLANYEFLLPPKADQDHLAELLWAMDELIEKEKVALEKLENLKLSFVKFEIFEKSVNEKIDFVKLGDIFDIKTGNKNAEDSVKDGIYPFFTRSIDTQRIDTYNYDQEALILPGEGNFQIKYYSGKFDVHQRTYILSKKIDSEINLKLYRDIVQAKVGELVQKSVGSTVDSLRKPIIENIKVPFLSTNKQKNLLEQSSIQDANISNFKMKLSASQSLQKGLINQIF